MLRWAVGWMCAAAFAQTVELPRADRPKILLVGSAEILDSRLRLTPAVQQVSGAAWFAEKQSVSAGFEFVFEFQLTRTGGLGRGADGLAFVLQNQGPDALAGRGGAAGFALGDGYGDRSKPGIPHSIAVFLDTYRNEGDPSDNYIAIATNGPVGNMHWPAPRLGVSRKMKVNLKDGKVHTVRVAYEPPVMTVDIDGSQVVRAPVDLTTVVDRTGAAYLGFTAATGAGFQNHDVLGWNLKTAKVDTFMVQSDVSYLPPNCMPGRNLCTPSEHLVEERGPGEYHVVLPPHIEWGASIPNASGREVDVANPRGNVCFGGKGDEVGDCGGPEGFGSARGGLLQPDRKPGALIVKTEKGRTWFSVNDSAREGFKGNQGFFEFDVKLR